MRGVAEAVPSSVCLRQTPAPIKQANIRQYSMLFVPGHCHISTSLTSFAYIVQVNIRRYNTVCGPGQCQWQEQAAGRLQNWQLQVTPDPQLVEVRRPCKNPQDECSVEDFSHLYLGQLNKPSKPATQAGQAWSR